jgi:hypothetical protein
MFHWMSKHRAIARGGGNIFREWSGHAAGYRGRGGKAESGKQKRILFGNQELRERLRSVSVPDFLGFKFARSNN